MSNGERPRILGTVRSPPALRTVQAKRFYDHEEKRR
jgi:hypothetical protein